MEGSKSTAPIIKICKVIDIDDPTGCGRIKAMVLPEDKNVNQEDIPWAIPLMPKHYDILPKIGEYVFIFTSDPGAAGSRRYFIGPVIAQATDLFAANDFTALASQQGAYTNPLPNPELSPELNGFLSDKNDVTISGRKNCDIQIKEDDIRIKAGVKKVRDNDGNTNAFNTDNTHAFIKLKYDINAGVPYTDDDYNSTATIVADRINLIGNRSKKESSNFDTQDPKDLITDDEMDKIMEKAHCLPYGDVLCDVLTQFYKCFKNHIHPFPRMVMCPTAETAALDNTMSTLEDDMLTNNIRIN